MKSTSEVATGKPPNLLFAIDYFHRTGGTEKHLAQLVVMLLERGFECTVVAFDMGVNPMIDQMRTAGAQVHHLPVGKIYTPNAFLRAMELSRIIRRNRIDIVQTFHQTSDTLGALTARITGVRHLVSSKRDTGQLKRPLHVFLNRRLKFLFDKTIVVADAVGDAVVAAEGLDRRTLVRIYNGVDSMRFSPPSPEQKLAQRRKLGIADDAFVAGMVAVFRPEKNHEIFFQGAERAMATIPELRLLVVGAGPLQEHFRQKYASRIEEGKIILAGESSDVVPYLEAMDIGCLIPGKNEGFSNSVIEKMATGLPMIVSDVGGNAEAVIDGENGLVIPPNDAEAFHQALLKLHNDPSRRTDMSRRSRQLVEEHYSLQDMCSNHEALYRSFFSGQQP